MLCNLERKFAVHAELAKGNGAEPEPEDVANTELIALTPQLAQEVIHLRGELKSMQSAWELVSIDAARTPAEQILAAQVVDHIDQALGETND